jgi:hypothetical protein
MVTTMGSVPLSISVQRCSERFDHLTDRPDLVCPERSFRCMEREVRSDNLTVGTGVVGFDCIAGESDNLAAEREGGGALGDLVDLS